MGAGKSSGSSQVVLTPEQQETLRIQNDALKNVFMPAYTKTVGTAGNVLNNINPAATQTAQTAMNVAQQTGALNQQAGSENLQTGSAGLKALFDPQYEQNQIQGALQTGREATREQLAGQNAMYGAAGGLGSTRQALADQNLQQLGEQRQATAAADAQAKVQANRANAAQALLGAGQTGLTSANQAAASRIGYAQTPQDVYSKYASIVFGVPQGSTTPNYAGTQGQNTSGSGKGFQFGSK